LLQKLEFLPPVRGLLRIFPATATWMNSKTANFDAQHSSMR